MSRISLQFSDLMSIDYNADRQLLEVCFADGAVHRYRSVPSTIYFSLLNAYSHDRYFEKYIKSIFDFETIAK